MTWSVLVSTWQMSLELGEAAIWIRQRSKQLHEECLEAGVAYIDVGEVGFETAMIQARRQLLGRG